jgi:hypothetical protein
VLTPSPGRLCPPDSEKVAEAAVVHYSSYRSSEGGKKKSHFGNFLQRNPVLPEAPANVSSPFIYLIVCD